MVEALCWGSGKATENGQQKRVIFFSSPQNELNSDFARFTTHVWTCLATNQVVASCVNTNFWLDKTTQKSLESSWRELRQLLKNKFARWPVRLATYTDFAAKRTVKPLLSGPPRKRTSSIKRTLSRVPKLTSYISLYNEPLFNGHLY